MDPKELIGNAIVELFVKGGQVGGWVIKPSKTEPMFGGMGIILVGERPNMRGQIERGAIKFQLPDKLPDGTLLKLDHLDRFEHEYEVLKSLEIAKSGGYVLRPLDSGSHIISLPDGENLAVPFFVTEYMEGLTLKDEVAQHGPLKGQKWLDFAHDLLTAADAIHTNGVIHQDIKPDNVMFHNGRYVLVDFGIASYINKPDPGDSGGGTPGYIAPEQFRGDNSDNEGHVDVYSIGATLVFAGTGSGPWEHVLSSVGKASRKEAMQKLFDAMAGMQPALDGLTKQQIDLVTKMMHFNYHERPDARYFLERVVRAMAPTNIRKKNFVAEFGNSGGQANRPKPAIIKKPAPKVANKPAPKPKIEKPVKTSNVSYFEPLPTGPWWMFLKIVTLGIAYLVVRNLHSNPTYANLNDQQRRKYRRLYLLSYIPFGGGIAIGYLAPKFGSVRMLYLGTLALVSSGLGLAMNQTYYTLLSVIWTIFGFNVAAKLESSGEYSDWNVALKAKFKRGSDSKEPKPTKVSKKKVQAKEPEVSSPMIAPEPSEDRAFAEDENGQPVFPLTWGDISAEIYGVLISSKKDRFSFDVESPALHGLYFQGYLESDGTATVECAADLSVRPKITVSQKEALVNLGWEPPTSKNPNFLKLMDLEDSDAGELAEFMALTIRVGYQVPIEGLRVS
jgi:serine/threonine protein kinase